MYFPGSRHVAGNDTGSKTGGLSSKGTEMVNKRRIRIAGAALVSGVCVTAAVGFAATAGAYVPSENPIDSWSNYEWCPGEPVPESDPPVNWDMNVCHFWHYQSLSEGADVPFTHLVEGLRPSPCPPIAFMCP